MDNPFRYGDVVADPFFTDRADELAQLTSDIRAGQNVILISPRRFGKTSLVKRAIDEVRRQGGLIAYVDLLQAPTKERLVALLAQAMYRDLASRTAHARHTAVDLIARLHSGFHFSLAEGGGTWSFAPTFGTRSVDDALEAILGLPGQIAAQRRKRVALVLDEFQACIDIDPTLPAVMRSVFQQQGAVSHVFLGSRQHLMRRVFSDKGQPMYRMGRAMTLHPIERTAWRTYLESRCRATDVGLDDDALTTLLDLTESLPYETQQLAYFAWNLALTRQRRINEGVVWDSWKQVVDGESTRYVTTWQSLSSAARAVLQAIAGGADTHLHSRDVQLSWQLGSNSAVARALASLTEAELIEELVEQPRKPHQKRYAIADPVFREWLRGMTPLPV